MSLLVWYQLNGDTINRGALGNELNPTATGVTYTVGITGQALNRGKLTWTAEQTAKVFHKTTSIAFWLKPIEQSGSACIIGNSGMGAETGRRKYTFYQYNSWDKLHYTWQNDDSENAFFGGQIALEGNKWNHIVGIQDEKNGYCAIYVNGERKAYSSFDIKNMNFTYNWPTTIIQDTTFNNICDFRVYDHALSQAEIKELSKALVLHYTFNDVLAEPTTNLISNLHSLVNCTRYDNGVKIDWNTNSADTYFFITPRETLISGDTYTISFWCDGVGDNNDVSFAMSNLGNTHKFFIHDGHNEFTFTMNDTIAKGCFLDDINRVSGKIFTLINIQLEKKDHATPYTPSNRGSMMVNETGYVNPSSVMDFSLSTVTNNGTYSGYFNGSTSCIDTPPIKTDMFTSDYTLNFWVYPLDNDRAIYFGDWSTTNSSNINFERLSGGALRYYHNGSPDKTFSTATTPANTWTMLTISYTPGVMKVYKNGILVETYSHTATLQKNLNSIMRIGRDNRSDYTALQGYISDFRFYTTCLNDDDIKDLYQTKAYISDKGDIMCNEFIEGKSQAQVTSKGTFEANEFYEEIDEEYECLEYIESTDGGGQYIDTGITGSTVIRKIETYHYLTTSKTSQILFGNNQYYLFYREWDTSRPYYGVYAPGSGYVQTSILMSPGYTYSYIELNSDGTLVFSVEKDGVKQVKTGTHTNTYNNAYNHFLFGYNNNGSMGYNVPCKMYMFRVYGENNILIRDFIPMKRKSDGVLGLYDNVNKVFYTNAGTGTFVAGPVLTNSNASIYKTQNVSGKTIIEI